MLKNRWKFFSHIFRLDPQTPAQQLMRHYFSLSQNSSFKRRQRVSLPFILNKDIVRASEHFSFSQRYGIQRFQSLQDLDRLIKLGHDRQLLKHLCHDIFPNPNPNPNIDSSPDYEVREYYYYYLYRVYFRWCLNPHVVPCIKLL